MENLKGASEAVAAYLAAQNGGKGADLASHNGADHCYLSSPEERVNTMAYEVSIEEAFRAGFLWLTPEGVRGLGAVIPLDFDFTKIRRRAEDALRKSGDAKVLAVAVMLGCKLSS